MYWLLNLMLFICYIRCQDQPNITTTCGTVQGIYLQSRNGRTFSAFFGIPFAEPPIGELRFEPPQPVIDCPDFIDASVEGPPCLQPNFDFPTIKKAYVGSEDCLNLNIYTPNVTTDDLLPVMVYFHEGSWILNGNSKQLHGPEYFMDEDIVLVVPNNRLHIFGYMSTEDYVVPGNMALKDQVAALQYVQDNIEFFNGDPDRVTIFGESAGASTTNLHMRSSLSKGLFKQGISQSGTASSAYSIIGVGTSLNFTKSIAARVNCDNVDTQQLVNCLRTIDAENLTKEHMNFLFSQPEARALFRPVIELKDVPGAFLTKSSLLTTTSYRWMTGFTTKDIAYKYGGFAKQGIDKVLALYDKNWDTLGPLTLLLDDTSSDPVGVAEKVRKYYFQDDPITIEKRDEITDMYTNFFVTNPMILDIRKNFRNTFVYQFDHLGEYTRAYGYGLPKNETFGSAVHEDDLIYLFPLNYVFPDLKFNEIDLNISKLMVKLWVNFATYGNPTPEKISQDPQNPDDEKIKWKPFGFRSNYLLIQTNKLSMNRDLLKDQYKFWTSLKVTDKLRSNFDSRGYLINKPPTK